ncbi:TonB-dependent receptor plug domain-containing protein [Sphingomonas sp. RS6]
MTSFVCAAQDAWAQTVAGTDPASEDGTPVQEQPADADGQVPVTTQVPAQVDKQEGDSHGNSILVTGSRLGSYDRSSDVKVYTSDDIKALGVSNVQDFIRSLPQNQASVGYGLNNRKSTEVKFDDGGLGGLGVAGVNLRGLGSKNTLVLVNGRRIAGAAGIEEGFANINNIPLAAVERVEVSLGGGSAIYGADALGGVVNFILKKGYKGLSLTARNEFSSTGADTRQATATAATAWSSGSVTATFSYTRTSPAENAKLGYTTHDYRGRISRQELVAAGLANYPLDQRSAVDDAEPGAIELIYTMPATTPFGWPQTNVRYLQWRPGTDFSNPTAAGLQDFDKNTVSSKIPPDAGEHQENYGLTLNVEQRITDRLRVTLDYLGTIFDRAE